MKRILLLAGVILAVVFASLALAQSPAPTGTPVLAVAASGPGFLSGVWAFIWGPGGACLFAALYAVSELMANCFPSLAANSFFQLFTQGLKKAEAKNPMPVTPSS